MKKMMFTLVVMMTIVTSATAMSGNMARMEARKATDNMSMMLGLTRYQYDRVYNINYDYFLRLDGRHDGRDLEVRNKALSKVLTAHQMNKLNGYHAYNGHHNGHRNGHNNHHNGNNHNKGWRK